MWLASDTPHAKPWTPSAPPRPFTLPPQAAFAASPPVAPTDRSLALSQHALPRPDEAQRRRSDVEPTPQPSFLSLPDIAHATISSFLPDGGLYFGGSRLLVSTVSRALLESYGESLTEIRLRNFADSSSLALACLMHRNQKLVDVTAEGRNRAIPALCQVIIQGCCRRIERMTLLARPFDLLHGGPLDLPLALAPAFEMDGALPALRSLCIGFTLILLARALARGTAPQLQELVICNAENLDFEALADMIEARVRLPECKRLEYLGLQHGWCWFDELWPATQVRLLRALLPSLKKFGTFTWRNEFEPYFLESKAPCLEDFRCRSEDFGSVFSSKVLEAAPALFRIEMTCGNSTIGGAALQAISAALRHGALQNLQELEMSGCHCIDGEFGDFVDALEGYGCTTRLRALSFNGCKVDDDGMRAFAGLLSQDRFPALEKLVLLRFWRHGRRCCGLGQRLVKRDADLFDPPVFDCHENWRQRHRCACLSCRARPL